MYLIDTNIVSELRRRDRMDSNVAAWASSVQSETMYLSVISVEELEVGVLRKERSDPAQGAVLRAWLRDVVMPSFAGRILDVDQAVAVRCAGLHVPRPIEIRDCLIAATALVHGLAVVTHNVRDFLPTGVRLLDPFVAATRAEGPSR